MTLVKIPVRKLTKKQIKKEVVRIMKKYKKALKWLEDK